MGRIALPDDAQHLLQRGGNDRAAALLAVEEGILVDLAGLVGVPDEHDVNPLIAALEEEVQQHEKTLGEVLLPLPHRSRDIHEAEHDRTRIGQRLRLETIEADVHGIDIGNPPAPALEPVELLAQLL